MIFVKRFLCFRWMSVLLLLLYSCWDGGTGLNITSQAGRTAVLPCSCPTVSPLYFIWQRNESLINWYRNDDKERGTAQQFENRTHVKIENGNCSLVFNTVRLSDEGLYTCYYNKIPLRHENIYLKVTDPSMACTQSDGVYHCQLSELHPEGQILWKHDGQLLPLSVKCKTDLNTGLCNTNDSITLTGSDIAKLTCEVKNSSMDNIVTICKSDVKAGPHRIVISSACAFFTIVLVIAAVFVGITCKKQQRNRGCSSSGISII